MARFVRKSRLAALLTAAFAVMISTPMVAYAAPAGGATAVAAPQTSSAGTSGTIVELRVEGATSTIFEGPVFTTGHDVTTDSGGTHHCDGTNNGVNPTPGPTATGALDDAATSRGFTWDGTFSPTFDDYFITRIAGDTQTATQFWGILLNGQFTDVGGCQQRVQFGDEVLFAFDAFNAAHFLTLSGPHVAQVGQTITVTVTDAMTGDPVAGASVGGQTTGSDGTAQITVTSGGLKRFKAERSDSIRSNALLVLAVH